MRGRHVIEIVPSQAENTGQGNRQEKYGGDITTGNNFLFKFKQIN